MEVINLNNLPDNFRIGLEDEFRKILFNSCIKKIGMKNLISKLGYARKTIESMRRGYSSKQNGKLINRFVKAKTVRKLASIANISFKEVESHIIEINSVNASLKVKLPIVSTKELASLLGHSFGDGYVGAYFGYFNKSKVLINEVNKDTQHIFGLHGNVIKHHGVYFLYFPGIISQMLKISGAPFGNKMKQKLNVPVWIKKSRKSIKSSFLRALFDDEGSVKFRGYDRNIQFALFKKKHLLKWHQNFMVELCKLLLDIQIMPSKLRMVKSKTSIGIRFTISDYFNLVNFFKMINFTHPIKRRKLRNAIESYKQIQYHHNKKFSNTKLIQKIILQNKERRSEKWMQPGVKIK